MIQRPDVSSFCSLNKSLKRIVDFILFSIIRKSTFSRTVCEFRTCCSPTSLHVRVASILVDSLEIRPSRMYCARTSSLN